MTGGISSGDNGSRGCVKLDSEIPMNVNEFELIICLLIFQSRCSQVSKQPITPIHPIWIKEAQKPPNLSLEQDNCGDHTIGGWLVGTMHHEMDGIILPVKLHGVLAELSPPVRRFIGMNWTFAKRRWQCRAYGTERPAATNQHIVQPHRQTRL
jgi:hypothetical protein